ncbi:uncharacterized protein EI90DRAFT_3049227, partial [Cantharellus anzutake]|uniref:uncharacterized protein n=1 Tax=Cantharellus anzutake TaxID=1750568 RepID=UPI0019054184
MEEVQTVSDSAEPLEDEEQDVSSTSLTRKVNPDGTVEQVDTIRWALYEATDVVVLKRLGRLEGLCWV